jgi:sugar lactone lactonase YvrE
VYAPGSGHVIRSISRFANWPDALAFDGSGNLYVSDYYPNRRIAVYPPGGRRPILSITDGVYDPEAIALDAGNLYVANCGNRCGGPGRGSVSVFAPGTKTPLRVIRRGVENPNALAFDNSGRLYVANFPIDSSDAGSVSVYNTATGKFIRTITDGIYDADSLAIDGSGNLYVASYYGAVTVYAPGASSPFETITDGVSNPFAIAFGP